MPGPDHTDDFTFRLLGCFRDCLSGQVDEAVILEMVQLMGRVRGDRGEGVGGRTVKVLNGRGGVFSNEDCATYLLPAVIFPFVSSLPPKGIWRPVNSETYMLTILLYTSQLYVCFCW